MKDQYSQSMREILGINEEDAQKIGAIPKIIAVASKDGLILIQSQLKIYQKYIEKRLIERKG